MRRLFIIFVISLLAAAGCVADSAPIASDELRLPANDVNTLGIEVGAGELDVVGDPSLDEITVTVQLRRNRLSDFRDAAAREALAVTLVPGDEPGVAMLTVSLDDAPDGYSADVVVAVPERLRIAARDGSGDLRISKVSALDVEDGSGDVFISDIAGDLRVVDASGDIDIARVFGNVDIVDASGDITVQEVEGTVAVDDGAGDIEARHVGDLEIRSDGSGDVTRS